MDQYKKLLFVLCLFCEKSIKNFSCTYPTIWGKCKNFIHIIKASVRDRIIGYSIYALINVLLLVGNQFINLNSSPDIYVLFKAKTYAFVLYNLYFLFRFFIEIRVPGWTCIIKMWLNKSIAEHSSKLFCQISIFPIKKF